MADEKLSLLDVAKKNSGDAGIGLIEEIGTSAPEAIVVAARSIRGTSYKTLHRVGLPATGFRDANGGIAGGVSRYELREVQCKILGGRVIVDKAVAAASEDGPEMALADEAVGVFESALLTLGTQFYYGQVNTSGFPGLAALVHDEMVLNAGGTTVDTASSVYGVKFGRQNVQFVIGQGGGIDLGDFRTESVEDADGNSFPAHVADLSTWIGLQATNKFSVGRLRDITEDTGKKLDDNLLGRFLEKFPVGQMPDALFMNRRSLRQLRESRTATNATGAPAPTPTEYEGIPIIVTDSIVSTETVASQE